MQKYEKKGTFYFLFSEQTRSKFKM